MTTTNYAAHFQTRQTPQSEQADPRQVPNSAGGFTFQLDKWQRLERFLILGVDGPSYYASERQLVLENAKCVQECLDTDGPRAVKIIADVSDSGRAPKNDPAIFALALAAGHADQATRVAALAALPRVCRIATHLFQFCEAVQGFRGWGRGLRRAVAAWYDAKTPEQLAYQVAKYGQRNGWSHRDLFRQAHPAQTADKAPIYRWLVAGSDALGERRVSRRSKPTESVYAAVGELPAYLAGLEALRKPRDQAHVVELIRTHRFTHEMIPTEWKAKREVWEALAETMPIGALVRNLAKLTEVGVISPLSEASKRLANRLADEAQLQKARVHPIAMLSALKIYARGFGEKGNLRWTPVPSITDALDAGFSLPMRWAREINIDVDWRSRMRSPASTRPQASPSAVPTPDRRAASGADAPSRATSRCRCTRRSSPRDELHRCDDVVEPLPRRDRHVDQ